MSYINLLIPGEMVRIATNRQETQEKMVVHRLNVMQIDSSYRDADGILVIVVKNRFSV